MQDCQCKYLENADLCYYLQPLPAPPPLLRTLLISLRCPIYDHLIKKLQ